jgi:hypothetical protein
MRDEQLKQVEINEQYEQLDIIRQMNAGWKLPTPNDPPPQKIPKIKRKEPFDGAYLIGSRLFAISILVASILFLIPFFLQPPVGGFIFLTFIGPFLGLVISVFGLIYTKWKPLLFAIIPELIVFSWAFFIFIVALLYGYI